MAKPKLKKKSPAATPSPSRRASGRSAFIPKGHVAKGWALSGHEIPIQIINWLGETPGKHCLVVLQIPNGSAYSVELYDVPVAAGDAIVGTAQDENLQRAFNGAMANYNLQAAEKGRQDYIV